ncbi:TetR/AcrR family transcriptional regulator [Chloroflexota bacterium]
MAARRFDTPQVTEQKKKQILDAALAVFSKNGYGESTVPEIAREANVAVGTIYNYFPSKRDLLISLMIDRFFNEPFVELLESVEYKSNTDFLAAFLENRIRFGRENVDNFVFLLSEVQRNSEVREQWVDQIIHPTLENIKSVLVAGMDDGKYESKNPEVLSRAVVGICMGFMLLHSIEKEKSPIYGSDPKKLAHDLANIVVNGIQKGER